MYTYRLDSDDARTSDQGTGTGSAEAPYRAFCHLLACPNYASDGHRTASEVVQFERNTTFRLSIVSRHKTLGYLYCLSPYIHTDLHKHT